MSMVRICTMLRASTPSCTCSSSKLWTSCGNGNRKSTSGSAFWISIWSRVLRTWIMKETMTMCSQIRILSKTQAALGMLWTNCAGQWRFLRGKTPPSALMLTPLCLSRNPVPDYYTINLKIIPDRTTAAHIATCNSKDPNAPKCPLNTKDGETFLYRTLNEPCKKMVSGGWSQLNKLFKLLPQNRWSMNALGFPLPFRNAV